MNDHKTGLRHFGPAVLVVLLFAFGTLPAMALAPATPLATPAVDQIALFDAAQDALRTEGEEIAAFVLDGDDPALLDRSAPRFREVLSQAPLADLLNDLQTDRSGWS